MVSDQTGGVGRSPPQASEVRVVKPQKMVPRAPHRDAEVLELREIDYLMKCGAQGCVRGRCSLAHRSDDEGCARGVDEREPSGSQGAQQRVEEPATERMHKMVQRWVMQKRDGGRDPCVETSQQLGSVGVNSLICMPVRNKAF